MVAQANDADDYYAQMAAAYTEETGVEIEMIPYPSDAYNTQVTTQLQAGNAADMMILAPGTGQAISVITLAEAGFLEPLDETSAAVIPAGTENLYEVDGEIFGQPTALAPVGLIYNGAGGEEVGIDAYPETYDDLLEACTTARDGGKTFTVLAGGVPFNTGLFSMLVSATRVYAGRPRLERAARSRRRDLRRQRLGGCPQRHHHAERQRMLPGRRRGRHVRHDHAEHRSGTSLTAAVPGSAAISIGAGDGPGPHRPGVPAGRWPGAVHRSRRPTTHGRSTPLRTTTSRPRPRRSSTGPPSPSRLSSSPTSPASCRSRARRPTTSTPSYEPIGELLETGAFVGLPNATWPNPAVYDTLGVGVQGLLTGQKTVDQVLEEMDAAWGE